MWTYAIDGMTCGGCAARIARAVAGIDPAATVTADVPGRRVRVASATASSEAIRQAIAAAGYEAKPVQEEPAAPAVARQGGCCCAARRAAGHSEAPNAACGA